MTLQHVPPGVRMRDTVVYRAWSERRGAYWRTAVDCASEANGIDCGQAHPFG